MKKILCIDDSTYLLDVLRERFEMSIKDVQVFVCNNGKDGIAVARKENPQVILLDVSMPGMDGADVLYALKHPGSLQEGEFSTEEIAVIILTAAGPEKKEQYLKAGARDYVTSPYDPDVLVGKVKAILESRQ